MSCASILLYTINDEELRLGAAGYDFGSSGSRTTAKVDGFMRTAVDERNCCVCCYGSLADVMVL